MTNFDVYERILQGTARLERRLDAKKHDKDALKIAMLWRKLRKKFPAMGVADFARLFDDDVPTDFNDYWDHPTYQSTLYCLFRAGAQPVLRADATRLRKTRAR